MSKQGSPEHRAKQSAAIRAALKDPEVRRRRSESQKKRFKTKAGKAHLARMRAARKYVRIIPQEYTKWNRRMRAAGIPAVKRIEAIRQRMAQEAKQCP
jgi:hypothetical protein